MKLNRVGLSLFQNILKSTLNKESKSFYSKHIGYDLKSYRSLLKVKGPDASEYIQGLITNDVFSLSPTENQAIYSMMLNNRGRVLFDVMIYNLVTDKNQAKNTEYLVELDSTCLNDALEVFNVYRLKKKVRHFLNQN